MQDFVHSYRKYLCEVGLLERWESRLAIVKDLYRVLFRRSLIAGESEAIAWPDTDRQEIACLECIMGPDGAISAETIRALLDEYGYQMESIIDLVQCIEKHELKHLASR